MKTLKEIHKNKSLPVDGNRSLNYVGVEMRMDQKFFHDTSDCGINKRPDPRLICCDREYHAELRSSLYFAAKIDGLSPEQMQAEWRGLVSKATKECTVLFKEKLSIGTLDVVPYSEENLSKLTESVHDALGWIAGEISKITKRKKWSLKAIPSELNLDVSSVTVYVKMQRHHSKETTGRKAYKIGMTTNAEARSKAHKTSNTDLEDIAKFNECRCVTERNIHKLFAAYRMPGETEWFLLTGKQVEVLKSFYALEAAILGSSV